MYQQSYNYYPNVYSMQQQQTRLNQPLLKGRPVSSIDEVKAAPVDFDGSIFYFPDLANNRIYTKQINLDGTASLCMYELKPIEPQLTTDYVTRQEFKETLEKLFNMKQSQEQPKTANDF